MVPTWLTFHSYPELYSKVFDVSFCFCIHKHYWKASFFSRTLYLLHTTAVCTDQYLVNSSVTPSESCRVKGDSEGLWTIVDWDVKPKVWFYGSLIPSESFYVPSFNWSALHRWITAVKWLLCSNNNFIINKGNSCTLEIAFSPCAVLMI